MACAQTLDAFARAHRGSVWIALAAICTLSTTGCQLPGSGGAVSVWIVSGDRQLAADSQPLYENEVYSASRGTVELVAAINETVGLQVALRALKPPAGPLDVRITNLDGPAGTLPAGSVTSLYRAHYVGVENYRSWYPAHTGQSAVPAEFPDILVPWRAPRGGGPLRLDQNRNEIIWIDLHVPPTTEPGTYTGRLEVRHTRDGSPLFTCSIRLTVLPVVIPSQRSLPMLCRIDPSELLTRQLDWPPGSSLETRILPSAPNHQAAKRLIDRTMELFHEHRCTPLLWAAFPKYRLTETREVEIDWEPYDQLVAGYLDGRSFADRVGLARWIIPASDAYPDPRLNGGFESARYARLLAGYLAECKRHFAERGWLARSFLRFAPPADLTQAAIERLRRLTRIVDESKTDLPVVAHLPPSSLRALGWHNAESAELAEVDIWAPPARWCEPQKLEHERSLGKQTWFAADFPPYSPSLDVEAPATDARVLAWQAFRYGLDAVWIEHTAKSALPPGADEICFGDPLIYPGSDYGLVEEPVPSIRLKRLRQGQLDYELLALLDRRGKPLLATRTAEQLVRWALTEACEENLISTRETGWPDNPYVYWLARRLLLQELVNELAPSQTGRDQQITSLIDWGTLMNQSARIHAEVRGVRLKMTDGGAQAYIFTQVSNASDLTLRGRWEFPALPPGWSPSDKQSVQVAPNGRASATVVLNLAALTYNPNGVYPFRMLLETADRGAFDAPGRIAIASCPTIDQAPTIDGELDDWMLASSNVAGDFRLVRGEGSARPGGVPREPALPTQAFFCMDRENLYVAVHCHLKRGERPIWRADNTVPLDGAIPWGQDLVEILLDPKNAHQGTAGEIYCLQIKPSGVLVARKGCLTDPPMNPSELWQSQARLAVNVADDAWVVEAAVPLSSLGPAAQGNRIWGCNVTRLDARRGEYSSWSGARGHAYAPQLLGNLILLRP